MFNVSDGAIIKWCKKLDVKRRGRGYWEKIYHNIHPQLNCIKQQFSKLSDTDWNSVGCTK